jgi:hypothetical protein
MIDNTGILEADVRYAVRMVRTGFFTSDQAARTCGIPLPILETALGESALARTAQGPLHSQQKIGAVRA